MARFMSDGAKLNKIMRLTFTISASIAAGSAVGVVLTSVKPAA